MSSGGEFTEVTRLAWEAILRATEEAVRPGPGGVPQDTIVCAVWCAHGKHRSVCLGEVLKEKARVHAGYASVQVVHCEQTRWDPVERARWAETERCFALPLEWMLERLEVNLAEVRHRICFIHLKGAAEATNRIRIEWCAAADRRVPSDFFSHVPDRLQQKQVSIPERLVPLS
jgi:hypothetical protein